MLTHRRFFTEAVKHLISWLHLDANQDMTAFAWERTLVPRDTYRVTFSVNHSHHIKVGIDTPTGEINWTHLPVKPTDQLFSSAGALARQIAGVFDDSFPQTLSHRGQYLSGRLTEILYRSITERLTLSLIVTTLHASCRLVLLGKGHNNRTLINEVFDYSAEQHPLDIPLGGFQQIFQAGQGHLHRLYADHRDDMSCIMFKEDMWYPFEDYVTVTGFTGVLGGNRPNVPGVAVRSSTDMLLMTHHVDQEKPFNVHVCPLPHIPNRQPESAQLTAHEATIALMLSRKRSIITP